MPRYRQFDHAPADAANPPAGIAPGQGVSPGGGCGSPVVKLPVAAGLGAG
ncbi:MAG: hypothetical protein LBD51_09590 [Bifidobacteriaceae bacterium]|nr:hypothetical protein [Bifidobacteriaceae bacterium]